MPKYKTHKGTVRMTFDQLRAAGYTVAQAQRMSTMDTHNELPKPRRGRPRKGA